MNDYLCEKSEDYLHKYFYEVMHDDFYTVHEVKGVCNVNHPLIQNPNVIADFLCYPKQHLIDSGFAETWFAVEIKAFKESGFGKLLRQTFWYTLSSFKIKGKSETKIVCPSFSLLWMPSFKVLENQRKQELYTIGFLNVGTINLQNNHYKWYIYCYGNTYAYHSKTNEIHITKDNLFGLKIGNNQKYNHQKLSII